MNNHAIKSGLMVGIIGIVLTLLFYIVDPTILGSFWMLLLILLFLVLVCYFGIQHRNEVGYLSFGKAWGYSMQLLIAAGIVGTAFNILLYNVIDPELPGILADTAVENAESMMKKFGTPEEKMDEALDRARQDALDRTTVVGSLTGFLYGLIFYAVISLFTGLVIRKKEPEFEG